MAPNDPNDPHGHEQRFTRIKAMHEKYSKAVGPEQAGQLVLAHVVTELNDSLRGIPDKLHSLENTIRTKTFG